MPGGTSHFRRPNVLLVYFEVEVRLEASRCLLTLIFCDFAKIDKNLQDKIDSYYRSKIRCTLHGAVLAMGAVVMAHPFSTPPYLIPMLKCLCAITSHSAELQKAATDALREFRRSHRENWEKTASIIGSELIYQIENAIAPIYYA